VGLVGLFAAAAAYHAVQSTLHVTPAVFTDELLHSKLAQSLAAGDGFSIRGEGLWFPAPLTAVLQAPVWLLGDVQTAYALAKLLNALVMSAAVFPAYWLARQLVRPSFAFLAAAAAVAAPALVYHSYLLSEALAYPVFLLAFAVLLRALSRPSTRWGIAALGVSLLAVGTRTQFVALPIVFALLLLARPRELRRHAVPLVGLGALAVAAVVGGTAVLGTYEGVTVLELQVGSTARWAAATAVLLPFAAGLFVVPGALVGLGLLAARPRTVVERGFAFLAIGVGAVMFVQAGAIAAGDAQRPLERYVIYLAPLLATAFFAYVERNAPWRRAYVGIALGLGLVAWVIPFGSLADFRFSFDSPVLAAYGTLAEWLGNANAATVFGATALGGGAAVAVRRLTARAARAFGAAAVVLLFGTGVAVYAGDHAMTERARAAWSGSPPDWLDEAQYGRADFLTLPGGSPHFAWLTEAWNRDFGRPLWFDGKRPAIDPWAAGAASISDDGTLLVDGEPARAGLLVVNDYASQIGLESQVLRRARRGLVLVRVPDAPRVRWLARGLFYDRWSSGDLRLRVWPDAPSTAGTYRVTVSIPYGVPAREIAAEVEGGARRVVRLEPGRSVALALPVGSGQATPPPLRVTSDRAEFVGRGTANPRLLAFRVDRLAFTPHGRARAVSF
jgi:hypothetical protein